MKARTHTRKPLFSTLFLARVAAGGLLFLLIAASSVLIFLLKTKEFAFQSAFKEAQVPQHNTAVAVETPAFPIGVDPTREVIVENPNVEIFFQKNISHTHDDARKLSWLSTLTSKLALYDWYQNLASPFSRVLVIDSGERKEEVASHFGKILNWDAEGRETFLELVASSSPILAEGKFYPAHYVAHKDATPKEVALMVNDQFKAQIASRYPDELQEVVPLEDALTIASLLEREAYDFEDMRYIAGIIWNRLFIDMNLQIDASLQYAKGSQSSSAWWPVVRPADKYINSPFNTYKNPGLPPSPIANPSPEAILAALNPKKTDCLFYFHDRDGGFHCTQTYEEHVARLKEFYGQGK